MVLEFLDEARNMSGPLGTEPRGRIFAFLANPSTITWDAASGIIIFWKNGKSAVTVWDAVKRIRPDLFEKLMHYEDPNWGMLEPSQRWKGYPNPFIVARAIRAVIAPQPQRRRARLYTFPS